jgi:tetratricopeptide (TPR) repeat protein
MRTKGFLKYSLLLYILFAIACEKPEKPVTKEEAAKLGKELAAAMENRNTGKFNQMIDVEAFKKRIREQGNNKLDRAMVEGVVAGLKSGQFGSQIVGSLGNDGTYQLVKQYEKDNHQHLLFRMYKDALNYHDYELIKKDEQVKIADIFIYTTGQNLTTTFTESLLSMSDQMTAVQNIDKSEINKVERIRDYLHKKDYEKAKSLYQTLPRVIRDQRLYKMIYIQIASGLDNDEYLKALTSFQQDYPDAPNMYLTMIDAYFLKKDYDGALKCVNQLDSLINKDPFLDYFRGLVCKQKEDPDNELFYFERLNKNMPDFASGTLQLISAYLEQKETGKAAQLTVQYRKNKDADKETLETLYLLYPDYKKKVEAAD